MKNTSNESKVSSTPNKYNDKEIDNNIIKFNKSYIEVMSSVGFRLYIDNANDNENEIENENEINENVITSKATPDKWDIISGLILAGVISASVFSISWIAYYIVMAMINSGIITTVTTTNIVKANRDKLLALFQNEMKWVFDNNVGSFSLVGGEIKELHFKIKTFLIEHFDNNEEKLTSFFEY